MSNKKGIGTTVIHGGRGPYDGSLPTEPAVAPIHMSTTFAFDTVEEHQGSIFGDLRFPMYTRAASGNPRSACWKANWLNCTEQKRCLPRLQAWLPSI